MKVYWIDPVQSLPKYNLYSFVGTNLDHLMDQLLVSPVTSGNKYLRRLDDKPTITIHIDNPLLTKNW